MPCFLAGEGGRGRRNFLWRHTQSLIALTCKQGAATRRAEYGHDSQSWVPAWYDPEWVQKGDEERFKMLPQQLNCPGTNFLRSSDHHEVAVTIPGKTDSLGVTLVARKRGQRFKMRELASGSPVAALEPSGDTLQ